MAEVNLLARYPHAKRNIKTRLGNKEENRRIALQFGKEYFDGTRASPGSHPRGSPVPPSDAHGEDS